MTARRWDDRPPARRPCFNLANLCAFVALILGVATMAEAGPIMLEWNESPDPTVIGYVILYGTTQGIYTGTVDAGNQTFATVRGLADGQSYYFVVQAYSAAGRLSTFSNVASGAAANQPPHITNPGPQAGAEGASVTLALAGTDPDADPLTYTATGLPPPLVLDPTTGVISGTIAYDAAGTYNVTATVSDGAVSSTATFQWVVANTNQPPVVSVPDLSHGMGAAISYAIPATEPDGTLMTFAATGLPSGLLLDRDVGTIIGTLPDAAGVYPVTLTVTDESLYSTTVHFQWTVLASNGPPTLAVPGDQEGSLVNPTSLQLAGSDPDGNTLTYSATGLPPGLFLDAHSGTIAGQPTTAGVSSVTVSVSDGLLASANRTFTWTVFANRAPTIQSLVNQSSLVNGLVNFTVQATDPEGSELTFSALGLPPGLVIDSNTGSITGVSTAIGVHPVTISVSDGALSDNRIFLWTILANGAPTLQNPGPQSSEEYRALPPFTVSSSDPDGNPLIFDAVGLPTGLWIDNESGIVSGLPTQVGTFTVTISVSDAAASASQTFQWVIFPNPPPTIEHPGAQTAVVGTPVFVPITATDPNGHDFILTASGLPPGLALDQTLMLILGTPTTAGTYPDARLTAFDGARFTSVSFTWTVAASPGLFTAVQANHSAPGGTPLSVTVPYTSPQLAGSLNVVAIGWHDATAAIASVRDSRGRTYELAVGPTVVPGVATQSIYYAANIVASAANENAVLVTFTGPATSPDVRIAEYAGVRAVAPVAGTAVAAQGSSAISDSGFLTTTSPTALLVAANLVDPGTTTTAGENFASRTPSSQGGLLEDRTVTALGNYNATAPVAPAGAWIMQLVAFRPVNTAPSLAPVPNQIHLENAFVALWLAGIDPDGDALTYDASGLPDSLGINNDTGLIAGDLTLDSAGMHDVAVTVSDGEITTRRTFTWTVMNRPPHFTVIPSQTSAEHASVSLLVTATDPDGTAVTYSATGLPDGLTIDATSGVISGTLSYTSAGTHLVRVTATDLALATGNTTFTWTVSNVNRPPALAALGNLSTTTQMVVSLPLAASEPDEDGDTVTYGAAPLPPGLSVNPTTGLISGTPSGPGVYAVTATATDANVSTSQSFVWTVVAKPVGRAKFIQANSSTPQTPQAAVRVRYPAAQSAGQLNVVVVGWRDATAKVQSVTDTTGNVYQLAVGPTMAAGVGTQSIYYAAKIAAAAAGGNEVMVTFTAPPTLPDIRVAAYAGIDSMNPFDSAAAASGTGATSASATVATTFPSDVLIAANLVSAPTTSTAGPGYRFRLLSRSGGLVEDRFVTTAGSHSATANLSPSSAWIMQVVAFRAPNHAPVLTSPGNQISTEHESIWVELAGHDPDDELLTYSITSGLPASLTLNASTGVISGTLSYASAGVYAVTATVSDGALASSTTFAWTVTDRNPALTLPTPGDFTGDGKADLTVYRPSTGTWSILKSGMSPATWSYQWGQSGDLPVRGDYDGDGRADATVYRPSTGTWFILRSSANYTTSSVYQWGASGDLPAPGDYDGDGRTDITVFRPSTSTWFILQSSTNFTAWRVHQWGTSGDLPVPGDYDGDGKTDIAVYRPSDGKWYNLKSSTNFTTWIISQWGISGDRPVPGDYDGDGKTDIAVYRPSTGTWWILKSSTNYTTSSAYQWGLSGDLPVPGDYDGDGRTDVTAFRPSTGAWFIMKSSTNFSAWDVYQHGIPGDIPVFQGR